MMAGIGNGWINSEFNNDLTDYLDIINTPVLFFIYQQKLALYHGDFHIESIKLFASRHLQQWSSSSIKKVTFICL